MDCGRVLLPAPQLPQWQLGWRHVFRLSHPWACWSTLCSQCGLGLWGSLQLQLRAAPALQESALCGHFSQWFPLRLLDFILLLSPVPQQPEQAKPHFPHQIGPETSQLDQTHLQFPLLDPGRHPHIRLRLGPKVVGFWLAKQNRDMADSLPRALGRRWWVQGCCLHQWVRSLLQVC